MKLATCLYNNRQQIAMVDSRWDQPGCGNVLLLSKPDSGLQLWNDQITTLQQVIEQVDAVLPVIENIRREASQADWLALNEVTLCAPIPVPKRNIICLGWNYAEHAEESSTATGIPLEALPTFPIVFTKATTTVNGPFDNIPYDERVSKRLDWEVELGVIIGKSGRHIAESQALEHVFGYTVINDVSARDLQKRHKQFFMGKSVDGTCPMGPWVVTADEIENVQSLPLCCKVNGIVKQQAGTHQQIFSVANIISALSQVMTLVPGDIIATGTPSGVGFARTPPEYLLPGDVVECSVEHVGTIVNTIKQCVSDDGL